MKLIKSLLLNLHLYYISILDYLDDRYPINHGPDQVIEQSRQNIKLIRGVRKLVSRLRNMTPEARLAEENLLSKEAYKKTRQEVREELKVRHKVINNPILKTEDDLVMKVVSKAPIYAKQQELRAIYKELNLVWGASKIHPANPHYAAEARRLKVKLDALKSEIERMKNG